MAVVVTSAKGVWGWEGRSLLITKKVQQFPFLQNNESRSVYVVFLARTSDTNASEL